jgi:hypothetical protein
MTMEIIREFIRREPFEPFVVRLSNGESHEVRHPECVAITRSKVVITYPDDDRVVHCGLSHVNSVETLQQA